MKDRTRFLYRGTLLLTLLLLVSAPTALGQVNIEVDFGFDGKFLGEHFTPVRVNLQYQGVPVHGELVLSQDSHRTLEGTRKLVQTKEIRLGSSADQVIDFYFPISRSSSKSEVEPILKVEFWSNGIPVATKDVIIPEDFEADPIVLVVSDSGFLRTLPTGERVEYVEVELLPADWRGYDGVRRIYLGRVRADLFSNRQQRAIKDWVYQGGELVVIGGENFFLQDRPWLTELLPMTISTIDQTATNDLPAVARGTVKGDVVTSWESVPLLVEHRVIRGSVLFSTIDLSRDGDAEREVWSQLTPGIVREGQIPLLGSELLDEMMLIYPDKVLVGGVLVLYLILFAYVSLWILKQPRWLIQRAGSSGVPLGRKQQGWKVLAFIAILVSVVTLPALGYLGQPLFGSNFYSIEVGVVAGENGIDTGWNKNWYSVVAKKELPFQLAAHDRSLVTPLLNTSLVVREHTDTYDMNFTPELMQSWSKKHLYLEQMLSLGIRTEIQDRTSSVSQPQVQVYNESQWHLEDVTIRRGRTYYTLGDLPSGMSMDRALPQNGSTNWPEIDTFSDLWSFEERVKRSLLDHLENDEKSIHSADTEWVLYAWIRLDQLDEQSGEHRIELKLLIMRL